MDGGEMKRQKETRWRESRRLLEKINNGSITLLLPLLVAVCMLPENYPRYPNNGKVCEWANLSSPTHSYILPGILFFSAFIYLYWKIIITSITGWCVPRISIPCGFTKIGMGKKRVVNRVGWFANCALIQMVLICALNLISRLKGRF